MKIKSIISTIVAGILMATGYSFKDRVLAQSTTEEDSVVKINHQAYTVLDHKKAADFCVKILNMEVIPIPDSNLAKDRSWVKMPNTDIEFHFIDAKISRGYERLEKEYQYIDELDRDMTVFTTYMSNHLAMQVKDLTPYLERLTANNVPFFGPVYREDGFYQIYLEIPGQVYIELIGESLDNSQQAYKVTTWDKVDFGKPASTNNTELKK